MSAKRCSTCGILFVFLMIVCTVHQGQGSTDGTPVDPVSEAQPVPAATTTVPAAVAITTAPVKPEPSSPPAPASTAGVTDDTPKVAATTPVQTTTTASAETTTQADAPPPVVPIGKIAITEPATSPYLCTAGEFVNIRCLNPVPDEVEWVTPDGRTLTADVDKFVINQSVTSETVSFFTIEGMTPEYAGIYTCRSVADHNNMEVITLVMAEEPVESTVAANLEDTTLQDALTTEDVPICRGDMCDDIKSTTAVAEEPTTTPPITVEAIATTLAVPVDDDPCSGYTSVQSSHFTKEKPDGDASCFGDFTSPSGWIKFTLESEDQVAEIPTVPIKQDYCGAHFAFHVNLEDKEMPSMNQTESAEICSYLRGEVDQPCANNKNIDIHNCNDEFFLYKFKENLQDEELCKNKGGANVCLKRPGENIPYEYQSIPDPTTTVTTLPDEIVYDLPRLDLTPEQENGTLTIEYELPDDVDADNCTGYWVTIDPKFRQMIADALNVYIAKPPEPIEVPVTTEAPTTTTVPPTTTATEAEFILPEITTRLVVEATTTPATTTTTTPAPTELADFEVAKETVLESDIEQIEIMSARPPVGAQLSDVVDNDPDVGPHKLKREVSQDIDVQVEENKKTDAEVTEEESTLYTKDHVLYVYDTPICASKTIQVAFVVSVGDSEETESNRTRRAASGGNVVPQDQLDKAVSDIDKDKHQENTGLEYKQHYQGQPRDVTSDTSEVVAPVSIWDAHMGLFIAVIVLLIICIIVIIIGILCIKCKGRKSSPEKTPLRAEEGQSPMIVENPVSDDEIVKGEVLMTESQNPAYTPNGSGQHLTKADEDNGWVAPMYDFSDAERERPEVENTKL